MRGLVIALWLLLPFTHAHAARALLKPQLFAVYFYADWCTNCKMLSPKLEEARSKGGLDEKPVLFVKLNLTDKPSIQQSILLAQALGIGDFLKAQGSATGYVALLDAKTKNEIIRFDRESSAADIQAAIEKNLKP